jgi:hypothetical protein
MGHNVANDDAGAIPRLVLSWLAVQAAEVHAMQRYPNSVTDRGTHARLAAVYCLESGTPNE